MKPSCVNTVELTEVVYFPEQAVALNDNDRDWIRLTVGEALRAHSSSKMARFKSWSPLGAVVAVGLFVLIQWNTYTVFKIHTEDHLIENDKQLLDLNLKLSAKTPINFKMIPKILNTAKAAGISPSIGAIQDAGQDLIRATEGGESAEAWSSVTALIDYRTNVNEKLAPPGALNLAKDVSGHYHAGYMVNVIPGHADHISSFTMSTHFVERDRAAVAETFERKEPREGDLLPEYVGFGGEITLDGSIWRNVVARNATVVYNGGPVKLENSYFINCDFQIAPTPNGRTFSNELLKGVAVTFTTQD